MSLHRPSWTKTTIKLGGVQRLLAQTSHMLDVSEFFCGPDAPPLLEVLVEGTRNNVQRYSGEVASVRARCASERRAPMVQVQRNTERRPKNRAKKSSGTRVIWLRVGSRCRLVFLPFVLAFACLLSRPVPGFRAAVPVGASAVLGRRLVLTGIP